MYHKDIWKYCKSIFIQVLPLHTEYALLSSDRNCSSARDDHERRSGVRLWYQRASSQTADSYQGGLCEFFLFSVTSLMKNWKQHTFQKYVLVNQPVEQNLKDNIHQDYLVSCINEMHENLGVESRESLRRDSEHLDQSSRDSSDTTIPTWEGKEPESKSKVVEERENASGLKSSTPTEMFGVVDYLYST